MTASWINLMRINLGPDLQQLADRFGVGFKSDRAGLSSRACGERLKLPQGEARDQGGLVENAHGGPECAFQPQGVIGQKTLG